MNFEEEFPSLRSKTLFIDWKYEKEEIEKTEQEKYEKLARARENGEEAKQELKEWLDAYAKLEGYDAGR